MTRTSAIPAWNSSGIIPPIRSGESGHSPKRSPYKTSLVEVIDRFCNSHARAAILEGYLTYRKELHAIGLTKGFQWLDGSFVEDKESRSDKAPADIDVVTFTNLPPGKTQSDLVAESPDLFNHAHVLTTLKVDSYFQFLGEPSNPQFVRQTSYWNSMWSHTRNQVWKGFLEVDLAANEDAPAQAYLAQIKTQI